MLITGPFLLCARFLLFRLPRSSLRRNFPNRCTRTSPLTCGATVGAPQMHKTSDPSRFGWSRAIPAQALLLLSHAIAGIVRQPIVDPRVQGMILKLRSSQYSPRDKGNGCCSDDDQDNKPEPHPPGQCQPFPSHLRAYSLRCASPPTIKQRRFAIFHRLASRDQTTVVSGARRRMPPTRSA